MIKYRINFQNEGLKAMLPASVSKKSDSLSLTETITKKAKANAALTINVPRVRHVWRIQSPVWTEYLREQAHIRQRTWKTWPCLE